MELIIDKLGLLRWEVTSDTIVEGTYNMPQGTNASIQPVWNQRKCHNDTE